AREQREPHVHFAAELRAKSARCEWSAAAAELRRAIDDDDVAHAARGQVIRDARADHAGAGNDDLCGSHATILADRSTNQRAAAQNKRSTPPVQSDVQDRKSTRLN